MKEDILFKDECYKIIGACMEVHSVLGFGFLEQVYQQALEVEFNNRQIPNIREMHLDIVYKGTLLEKKYVADFLCYDSIIVELKAVEELSKEHTARVLNYLKTTGNRVGLLVNFGKPSLERKRLIL